MFRLSRIFEALMIVMDMRSEKIILKISSDISRWHLNRSTAMPKWDWLEKLIGDGKIAISTIDVG